MKRPIVEHHTPNSELPPIPAKRYFTIGEVSELCAVKSHVLRYWEQEFSQLKPVKRRGNRRYYQHHEVLLIRRIRQLLYEEGFTISGARSKLSRNELEEPKAIPAVVAGPDEVPETEALKTPSVQHGVREELIEILSLLRGEVTSQEVIV